MTDITLSMIGISTKYISKQEPHSKGTAVCHFDQRVKNRLSSLLLFTLHIIQEDFMVVIEHLNNHSLNLHKINKAMPLLDSQAGYGDRAKT